MNITRVNFCIYEIAGEGIDQVLKKMDDSSQPLLKTKKIGDTTLFIHGAKEHRANVNSLLKKKIGNDLTALKSKMRVSPRRIEISLTELPSESSSFDKSTPPISPISASCPPELLELLKDMSEIWKSIFCKYFELLITNKCTKSYYDKIANGILSDMLEKDLATGRKLIKTIKIIAKQVVQKTGVIGLSDHEISNCTTHLFRFLTAHKLDSTKKIPTPQGTEKTILNILATQVRQYNQDLAWELIKKTVAQAFEFLKSCPVKEPLPTS